MQKYFSLFVLLFSFLILCFFRYNMLSPNELSWDVFGYYLYLPAVFVHHDFFLKDISWIHQVMSELPVSATLYQLTQGPEGNNVYFFLMGTSLLYAPFFFIGHFIALLTGQPADGFSIPYQYTIALGGLVYSFLGLSVLRKILLSYFTDAITAIVLIVIVFGTNYFHFATLKNLETANLLFTLLALVVWFTMQWHKGNRTKYLVAIFLAVGLSALVKPSEIICGLIPFVWGVYNRVSFTDKIKQIIKYRKQFTIAACTLLAVFLPQIIYWKISTGYFIFDSYKNPGVGLDLFSPHMAEVLFSFRKGWLLYTPVMIFALTGFIYVYKKQKEIFPALIIYFILTFYIIASWTEWWYGAGYSIRPLVPSYVILSIPLGCFFSRIRNTSVFSRIFFLLLTVFFITLNLFQLWQFNNYILDPYRTTKSYYLEIFGKTKINPETRNLLSIERSFDGQEHLNKGSEIHYNKRNIGFYDFSDRDTNFSDRYVFDSLSHSMVFKMDSTMSFSQNIINTFNSMTGMDHVWVRASVEILIPSSYNEELPCLVVHMVRKEGVYAYRTATVNMDSLQFNKKILISMDYLIIEPRSKSDKFQSYIWHRGKQPVFIDNFKVDVFDPKY